VSSAPRASAAGPDVQCASWHQAGEEVDADFVRAADRREHAEAATDSEDDELGGAAEQAGNHAETWAVAVRGVPGDADGQVEERVHSRLAARAWIATYLRSFENGVVVWRRLGS
jgi:hypothetical protein